MGTLQILSSPEKTVVLVRGEDTFNALVNASEIYTMARLKWVTSFTLTLLCVSFALLLSGVDAVHALRTVCTMLVTYSMTSLWYLGKYRGHYKRARDAWLELEKAEGRVFKHPE